jgi:DHA1 family bicyclomycin/chloramphenicol resistance-like MFS transporter
MTCAPAPGKVRDQPSDGFISHPQTKPPIGEAMLAPSEPLVKTGPGFAEFVGMIASMMAVGALGIDTMLPALPTIGSNLHVQVTNHLQWIISAYFLGMGAGQLVVGTLSDWLGRKSVLLWGVALYALFSLVAATTPNFALLLLVRLFQGAAAATSNVITRSIVRDRYAGPRMAKVISISYVIFLIAPILAPSIGQLILLVAPWPAIFLALAAYASVVGTWVFLRLPETHDVALRFKPDFGHLRRVSLFVLTEPSSLFYTIAMGLLFGSLMAYVSLMPQIFQDVFRRPGLMAPVFAACAATIGAGSMLNASLVERLGLKRISHTALTVFIGVTLIHWLWATLVHETILSFLLLQAATMGCMSLTSSNFSAIAMEKVGHVAGTAASIQAVASTLLGTMVASVMGQFWTGHIGLLPITAAACGLVSLGLVAIGEKGRLYRNAPPE